MKQLRLLAFSLVFSAFSTMSSQAQTWGDIATSGNLTANRLCSTDGTDIICDTNAPSINGTSALDVSGSILISSTGSEVCNAGFAGGLRYIGGNLEICDGTAWEALSLSSSALNQITAADTSVTITDAGSGTIDFSVDGATRATLSDDTLNLAVNTVDMSGFTGAMIASNTSGYLTLRSGTALGSELRLHGESHGAWPSAAHFRVNNAPVMALTNAGDLGVGTTTPTAKLHLYTSGNTAFNIESSDATNSDINFFTKNKSGAGVFDATTKGWNITARGDAYANATQQNDLNYYYWDGTTFLPRFSLDANLGYVGVGTVTPTSLLHVKHSANNNVVLATLETADNTEVFEVGAGGSGDGYAVLRDTSGATRVSLVSDDVSYFTNGNVGFGTTTPNAALDVSGSIIIADGGEVCNATTEGGLRYAGGNMEMCDGSAWTQMATGGAIAWTVSGTDAYRSAGNVGVGTSAPEMRMHLFTNAHNDGLSITGSSGGKRILMGNQDSNGVNSPSIIAAANGELLFGVGDSWTGNGGTLTLAMVVKKSGNIGIGTDVPAEILEVADNNPVITIKDANDVSSAATVNGFIGFEDSAGDRYAWIGEGSSTGNFIGMFDNRPTSELRFGAAGQRAMTINSAGFVGMGITAPEAQLHADGDILIERNATSGYLAALHLEGRNTTSSRPNLSKWTLSNMNENGSTTGFSIYEYYDANNDGAYCNDGAGNCDNRFTIKDGGNVGIGIDTPVRNLHVHNVADADGRIIITNTDTGVTDGDGLSIGLDAAENVLLWNRENTLMAFATNNQEAMRIDNNGKVGIGNLAPSGKLDVRGDTGSAVIVARTATNRLGEFGADATPDGFMRLYNAANALTVDIRSDANHSYINGGSRLGLGTVNPNAALDVSGSIIIADGGEACNATTEGGLRYTSGNMEMCDGTAWTQMATGGSTPWNVSGATINYTAGAVGVGVNSPSSTVHILSSNTLSGTATQTNAALNVGDAASTQNLLFDSNELVQSGDDLFVSALGSSNAATGNFVIRTGNDTVAPSERMRVTPTGLVGIGTTNPDTRLHVASGAVKIEGPNIPLMLTESDQADGTLGKYWRMPLDGTGLRFDSADNAGFSPYQTVLQMNADGRVGVNTPNPSAELDVSGTVEATAFVGDGSGLTNVAGWTTNATQVSTDKEFLVVRTKAGAVEPGDQESAIATFGTDDTSDGKNATALGIYAYPNSTLNGGYLSDTVMLYADNSTDHFQISAAQASATIRFTTSGWQGEGTERVRIDDEALRTINGTNAYVDGKMGVGTISPLMSLQVSGTGDSGTFTHTNWQAGFGEANLGEVLVGTYEDQPAIQGHGTGTSYRLLLNPTGGNVGIGTTSPLSKLHLLNDSTNNLRPLLTIDGASNTERAIAFSTDGTTNWWFGRDNQGGAQTGLGFYNTSLSAFTLLLEDSGSIGMGVTNATGKLHVKSPGTLAGAFNAADSAINVESSDGTSNLLIDDNEIAQSTDTLYLRAQGDASTNGNIVFQTGNPSNANAERVRITAAGDLGVGVTTPRYKLDVNGGVGIGDTGSNYTSMAIEPASAMGTYNGVTEFKSRTTPGSGIARYAAHFKTNVGGGSTRMDVLVDGSVGVGTTNPATALDVSGTLVVSNGGEACDAAREGGLRYTGGNMEMCDGSAWATLATGGSTPWNVNGSAINYMAGNVGIGLSNPLEKFVVESGADDLIARFQSSTTEDIVKGIRINARGATNVTNSIIYGDIGVDPLAEAIGIGVGTQSSNLPIAQSDLSNAQLVVRRDGRVGIGPDDPWTSLHVTSEDANGDVTIQAANIVDAADEDAFIRSYVQGANSGDPYFRAVVNGVSEWAWGIDNSDADKFKIASTGALGTSQDRVTVTQTGDMGIGTNNPAAKLHVNAATVENQAAPQEAIRIEGPNSPGNMNSAQYINYAFRSAGSARIQAYRMGSWGTQLQFMTNANTETSDAPQTRMTITDIGRVGIGTETPAEQLEVNGNARATSFISSSDRNLKENIKPLENSLEKVAKLEGVSYVFKEETDMTDKPQVGLIAQDVEKIFPEVVNGEEGKKGVNYAALVSPLIEAVKELKELNEKQQSQIDAQAAQIDQLIKALEAKK